MDETNKSEQGPGSATLGVAAAVAGWAVPGLGHLLLRRWSKAAVYFIFIGALAYAGLAMRGGVAIRPLFLLMVAEVSVVVRSRDV